MKRITAEAYQALREAIAVIVWNKRPFESYLRAALRDHPELLVELPFSQPKRLVADLLVDRLISDESTYQQVTLDLMRSIKAVFDPQGILNPGKIFDGKKTEQGS